MPRTEPPFAAIPTPRRRLPAASVVLLLALLLVSLAACSPDGTTGGEPASVGGPLMIRRLTEEQYRATVADIFGADVPIAGRFEKPVRSQGLVAVGTGAAGMSSFAIEQYDVTARAIAGFVFGPDNRDPFLSCEPASGIAFDEPCAKAFFAEYGSLLLRRPLRPEETSLYVAAARRASGELGDFYQGMEIALAAMLITPEFLYRIEAVAHDWSDGTLTLDPYSKAARLSFFLTNSSPDRALLEAAARGDLDTEKGLRAEVDRLMASERFPDAVRAFFEDMLEFDAFEEVAKDPAIYPAFNTRVARDAQEQTLRTILEHVLDENGDYRDLFTTRRAFLTRPLGVIYRVPVAKRNGWVRTEFAPASGRRGIQSHIAFLALHAHPGRSSPTLRGYAIREVFLCQHVPDAPADVDFAVVQDPSNMGLPTARDRLVAHRTQPACAGCHKVMDPLGLTLEAFDGVGKRRSRENGVRIDTSGALDGWEFETAGGLAEALRDHPETPRCLVERMYKAAVGRDITWDERPYLDWLIETFEGAGYRVPELMRAIALSENFFAIAEPPANMASDRSRAQTLEDGEPS